MNLSRTLLLFAAATTCGWAAEQTAPFQVQVTGKGRPVLMIPGLSSSGKVWDATVENWKGRFECHVFTLAGFAGQPRTQTPSLLTVRDSLISYIRINKLQKPIIMGHSLGGFMALWIASTEPDLVGDIIAVDSLPFLRALQNPKATAEDMKPMAESMRKAITGQTIEQYREYNRKQPYLRSMVKSEKDYETILSWSDTSDPVTVGNAMHDMFTTDLRKDIAKIKSRVLVFGTWATYGKKEAVEQTFKTQYAELKNLELIMMDDAHHFVMLDAPAGFQAAIDRFTK